MLRKEEIKVIAINKPDKEKSEQRIRALCDLLGKLWKTDESNK